MAWHKSRYVCVISEESIKDKLNCLAVILLVMITSWNIIKLLSKISCIVFRLWTNRDFPGEMWRKEWRLDSEKTLHLVHLGYAIIHLFLTLRSLLEVMWFIGFWKYHVATWALQYKFNWRPGLWVRYEHSKQLIMAVIMAHYFMCCDESTLSESTNEEWFLTQIYGGFLPPTNLGFSLWQEMFLF